MTAVGWWQSRGINATREKNSVESSPVGPNRQIFSSPPLLCLQLQLLLQRTVGGEDRRGEERRGEVGGQGDGAEGGGGVRAGRVPRRPLGGARLRGGGHARQGAPRFASSLPLPTDAPPASPRSTHRACLLIGHRSWSGRALLACLLRVRSRFRSRRGGGRLGSSLWKGCFVRSLQQSLL